MNVPLDLQLACCVYVQFLWQRSQLNLLQDSIKNKDVSINYGTNLTGSLDDILQAIEPTLARYRNISTL